MQDLLDQMRRVAARHAAEPRRDTAVPGMALHVGRVSQRPLPSVYEPSLCLVLQGAKQVTVGDRALRYDTANCFIVTVDLPTTGWIVEGEGARPYVSVSLRLDLPALCGLIADLPPGPTMPGRMAPAPAFATSPTTPELLAAWSRLLCLLDTPADVPVLAPLHQREVLYRLLQGSHATALRQLAQPGGRIAQIRPAIAHLRSRYDQPVRVEHLAGLAGMSPATFHRHFKAATAMSPVQYQKALRLQQARRLLAAQPDSARAGHAVGYQSASQFSRDYARMFGLPPGRDAARMRGDGVDETFAGHVT